MLVLRNFSTLVFVVEINVCIVKCCSCRYREMSRAPFAHAAIVNTAVATLRAD